jgi:hypothetical protein
VHNFIKYEFDFRFDVPATYPAVAPEIELPELEGKTAKMYRGGKICLTIHFKPLWAKNRWARGSSSSAVQCAAAHETACMFALLMMNVQHPCRVVHLEAILV